jgi:hypothetical protein
MCAQLHQSQAPNEAQKRRAKTALSDYTIGYDAKIDATRQGISDILHDEGKVRVFQIVSKVFR